MSCLHFRIDRRTRICPDCGVQIGAPVAARVEIINMVADAAGVDLQQPQAPPEQEIALRAPAAPLPPPVELPEGDDIHEILAKLKTKKAAPAAPAAPPAPPAPVKCACGSTGFAPSKIAGMCEFCDGTAGGNPPTEMEIARQSLAAVPERFDQLAAARDAAVAAATPDWIKDAEPVAEPGSIAFSNLEIPEPADAPEIPESAPRDHNYSDTYAPGTYPEEPVFSFLGGTAGTGKTYTAAQRVAAYDDAKLVATTGIAAVNLGGVTINSLLQYGDTKGLRACYEIGKLGALLRRMTQSGYFRLIVDEVSMMDGHQLDILVTAIEELNQWLGDNGKRLFGMTLVGDFAQLPPIDAPFVFQRPTWGRFEPNITMLTEPRRQADANFVRALQAVRRGDRKGAMEYFRPLIVQGSEDKFDGSTIMATNAEVDRYNKLRMMDITQPADWYKADRVGEQLNEWKKNIPDQLEMKPGALVMILANRTVEREMLYANGDLGHYVKKLNDHVAEVQLIRTGSSVLVQTVLKEHGVATGHTGKKLARNEVKGSINYMPLRVAYATTCHKSQGLSLDRVQIMFHNRFWANPGMLYVALSRARTPQGLRLVGTPEQFEARIVVNPDIRRWL